MFYNIIIFGWAHSDFASQGRASAIRMPKVEIGKHIMPDNKKPKSIGVVTHYYGKLGVAIVKFNQEFSRGSRLRFFGATTDFEETVNSIEYDHKSIETAKKGQEVGIKVSQKVREGDEVYEA